MPATLSRHAVDEIHFAPTNAHGKPLFAGTSFQGFLGGAGFHPFTVWRLPCHGRVAEDIAGLEAAAPTKKQIQQGSKH